MTREPCGETFDDALSLSFREMDGVFFTDGERDGMGGRWVFIDLDHDPHA